jgi:hypothetical protein
VRTAFRGGAANQKFSVSRGNAWSPDSESARREPSKSCLASHFGPQKCDFASRAGGPLPEVLRVPSGIRTSLRRAGTCGRMGVSVETGFRRENRAKFRVRARAPGPLQMRRARFAVHVGGMFSPGARF